MKFLSRDLIICLKTTNSREDFQKKYALKKDFGVFMGGLAMTNQVQNWGWDHKKGLKYCHKIFAIFFDSKFDVSFDFAIDLELIP